MKKSIELISKKLEERTDVPRPYVINESLKIIQTINLWPWRKDYVPHIDYRIQLWSEFAADIVLEIERLLKEKQNEKED